MRRIPIEELTGSPDELLRFRELLGNGGLAAVPTESSYAFAVDPLHPAGVRRILDAKGRNATKALPVLFADRPQLDRLGVASSARALAPFFQIWPAALTVILPIGKSIPASGGMTTLAVRMPAERRLRRLLAAVGALTGTSLNRAGGSPLEDPNLVEEVFRRQVDVLVDGGKTPGGKPSTILDATREPPVVVRPGAFAWSRM